MIEINISNVNLAPFRRMIGSVVQAIDLDDPPVLGILCNGSVPLGLATDASDLDLCVCCDAAISRFLRRILDGQAVDVHFEDARWLRGTRPPYGEAALFMLANAAVLWEREAALSVHVVSATEQFSKLAPALSHWDRFQIAIDCSTSLRRFSDSIGNANLPFLLGGLLERAVEATLRLNRRWYLDTGHGMRDLQSCLPDLAIRLSRIAAAGEPRTISREMSEYLSDLFDERMPLEQWDSGIINHEK